MNVTNMNHQIGAQCCSTLCDLGERPFDRIIAGLKGILGRFHPAAGIANQDDALDLGTRCRHLLSSDAAAQCPDGPLGFTRQHVKDRDLAVFLCTVTTQRWCGCRCAHIHAALRLLVPRDSRACCSAGQRTHDDVLTLALHREHDLRCKLGQALRKADRMDQGSCANQEPVPAIVKRHHDQRGFALTARFSKCFSAT